MAINPGIDDTLYWSTFQELFRYQHDSKDPNPKGSNKTYDGQRNGKNVLLITEDSGRLKLRIIISAHSGQGGHRSWRVTMETIQEQAWWKGVSADAESFIRYCLH